MHFIFLNENILILITNSLKFIPSGLINNIRVLIQKMAWRRPDDKPLFESMMIILLTHIRHPVSMSWHCVFLNDLYILRLIGLIVNSLFLDYLIAYRKMGTGP